MPVARRRRLMWLKLGGGVLVALFATALAVRVLAPLPPLAGRTESRAVAPTDDTRLGRAIGPVAAARPGLTGVHLLPDPHDAFAARVALARAAERTLDLRYYIWNGDLSGLQLMTEVTRAADRGVRVRLLIDDNTTAGLDPLLAALDSHPMIELRLFNPFTVRRVRPLAYLADFPRLNRRMHNKSFTADGAITVVGGRNIGDEYFGARDEGLFVDLDAVAIGAAVADVRTDFDRYWASGSAYPVGLILAPPPPGLLADVRNGRTLAGKEELARTYAAAIARSGFMRAVLARNLPIAWAPARLLSDDPAKGLGRSSREALVWTELDQVLHSARSSVRLVSGYFVPAEAGTALLNSLARRGVDVQVATNSYSTTDVPIVHAGYVKRRDELLQAGVTLYELASPARAEAEDEAKSSGNAGSRFSGAGQGLHAKTFTVDGRRLFVGSFNFDPRSAALNTEMGLVIESPELTGVLNEGLRRRIPAGSYQVVTAPDGDLRWIIGSGNGRRVSETEPGMSTFDKFQTGILSLLPIEWML